MERSDARDRYPDVHPFNLLQLVGAILRRLRVLVYLALALAVVAVLGAFLPLGAWLLLCLALVPPTLASALLVSTE
jgi:hypothetical protein